MFLPEDVEFFSYDYETIAEAEDEDEDEDRLFESGIPDQLVVEEPAARVRGRGRGRGRRGGRPRMAAARRGGGQGRQRQGQGHQGGRLSCPMCKKTYASETTLKTHQKKHVFTDLMSRIPKHEALRLAVVSSIAKALETIVDSFVCDDFQILQHASTLVPLVQDLAMLIAFLQNNYSEALQSLKGTFKTSLRTQYLMKTNQFVTNEKFMSELKEIFEVKLTVTSAESLNFFSGVFMNYFSQELLVTVLRAMLGTTATAEAVVRKKWSSDDVDSEEFKEIIYYIGGAVVHTFHRSLRRHPTCPHLLTFCEILKERFQKPRDIFCAEEHGGGGTESYDEHFEAIKDWTKARDRGGLIFLTKDSHNFFVALADFVLCREAEDGSLEQDFVFASVLKDPTILSYWDTLIGAELEEQKSLDFLQAVCEVVVKCARQGILKRRLNAAMKAAYTSVSLRHRLTR